jgi:Glycosyl transferases group 1
MADGTEGHGGHRTSVPELGGDTVIVVARRVPPAIGGEEGQVGLLCSVLVEAGATVQVWTMTMGASLPAGVQVRILPRSFKGMPLYLAWLGLLLVVWRGLHPRTPAALVTTRVSGDSALMARLGRLLQVPVVMFLSGGLQGGSEFAMQRRPWVKRWIIDGSAAMVSHAESFLAEVREAGFTGTTECISTIVDSATSAGPCRERLPASPGSPRLMWCGRNAPVKNLPALSRLFGGALLSYGNPSLLVVADEPPAPPVAGAELHLRCPSPRVHMASTDVLLLTSDFEGQGAVIAEAAVEGTPTVAYAVGGIAETMARLDGGEVVAAGAPDEVFAGAVARAWRRFSDPGERSDLSARAEQLFQREPPAAWVGLLRMLVSRS